MRRVFLFCAFVFLIVSFTSTASYIDTSSINWSVQYMLDTSQSDFGEPQSPGPRDNRGLAISPDGRYLYAGYNNDYGGQAIQVRKIDLTVSDYIDASVARLTGVRGKSIDVDDMGRVYLAEGSSIKIYDGDLTTELYSISTTKCEGLTVRREGGTLALYATDRTDKTVTRWELSESGLNITGHIQAGLGGTGQVIVPNAQSLRGLAIDPAGRIWMADIDADKVFRLNSDGTGLTSADVVDAIDIDFDGDRAFVTQYETRTISVLDADMSLVDVIMVPWGDLELDPDGQDGHGALSGIVVLDGIGFYVSNESGQTADEKSTYGRIDENSGYLEGKFYTDLYHDDNDPILFATPEPATILLLAVGLIAIRKK